MLYDRQDPWQIYPQPEPAFATEVSCQRAGAISAFSLQLNAINSYWVLLWKRCGGDRSACPGAESHCRAPEQVQLQMEAVEMGWAEQSWLCSWKTEPRPALPRQSDLLASEMDGKRQISYAGNGVTQPKLLTAKMKYRCPEIPTRVSSSPSCMSVFLLERTPAACVTWGVSPVAARGGPQHATGHVVHHPPHPLRK